MIAFRDVWRSGKMADFRGTLVTYDPGETTGFSAWEVTQDGPTLKHVDQLATWPLEHAVDSFQRTLIRHEPTIVVFESYNIYNWKVDDHANSDVPTLQVIGCLKTILIQRGLFHRCHTQTAQIAKQFCTDEKLTNWHLYQPGLKHGRDAIRHGAYFLIFGPKAKK